MEGGPFGKRKETLIREESFIKFKDDDKIQKFDKTISIPLGVVASYLSDTCLAQQIN